MGRPNCYQRCHALDQVNAVCKCVPRVQPAHAVRQNMHSITGICLLQDFFGKLIATILNRSDWIYLGLKNCVPLVSQMVGNAVEVMQGWQEGKYIGQLGRRTRRGRAQE